MKYCQKYNMWLTVADVRNHRCYKHGTKCGYMMKI